MTVGGTTFGAEAALVSGDCFSTYGFSAVRGRLLGPGDVARGADPVAVISARLWKQRFGGEEDVIGARVRFNGHELTIIGVAPTGPDLWAPITMVRQLTEMPEGFGSFASAATLSRFYSDRTLRRMSVTARLRDGVKTENAASRAGSLGAALADADPGRRPEFNLRIVPAFHWTPDWSYGQAARLMAVSGLVLFIACANLVGMLLARGASRTQEIAVRRALGADRWRIVRQLMLENLVLAAAAGLGGLAGALTLSRALARLDVPADSRWTALTTPQVDWRLLTLAGCLVLLAALGFGLWPALRTSRATAKTLTGADGIVAGYRRRVTSFGNLLLISQFGVSTLLVLLAGAFVADFVRLSATDTGLSRTSAGTVELMLDLSRPTDAVRRQLMDDLRRRALSSPDIDGLAFASSLPIGRAMGVAVTPEGRPPRVAAAGPSVGQGLFDALGIPLVQGRDFDERDTAEAPRVAIASKSAATKWFPGQSAVGRRFSVNGRKGSFEIVGVVGDTRADPLGGSAETFYVPLAQSGGWSLIAVATSSQGSAAAIQAVRRVISEVDQNLAIGSSKSVAQRLEDSRFTHWLYACGFGALAGLALLLAAVGIHGTMAYLVSRQTREFGLRLALGAAPRDLRRMILWRGLRIVAIGMTAGLYAAVLAVETIQKLMLDTATSIGVSGFAVGPAALALAALTACYLPARRAAKIDAAVALRAL